MEKNEFLAMMNVPQELVELLKTAKSFLYAGSAKELEELSCGEAGNDEFEVAYEMDDGAQILEAVVSKVRNGISVNYVDPYMRRRDPDCMFIGDTEASDKPSFKSRFGYEFAEMRKDTFDWLSRQDIAVFAFEIGQPGLGGEALAVCPANSGFFAFGLALLQGIVDVRKWKKKFKPSMVLYVAPPFRHSRFAGRQVVVHNRSSSMHEIFSYNLYPGPSAKKAYMEHLSTREQGKDGSRLTAPQSRSSHPTTMSSPSCTRAQAEEARAKCSSNHIAFQMAECGSEQI